MVQGTQPLQQAVGTAIKNTPYLNPTAFGPLTQKPAQDYVRNQVVNQVTQGFHDAVNGLQQGNLLNTGIGAFRMGGGVFNATPPGMAFNSVYGGVTGATKAIRTRTNPLTTIQQSIANPSGFGSEGLGLKGIPGAAVDLASGFVINPEMGIKGFNALRNLKSGANITDFVKQGQALGLKGINPRAFNMTLEDKQSAMAALDMLRYENKKTATPEDTKYALQTIQNLLDAYAPGHKLRNNKKALDAVEWLIQTNDKLPGNMRTPLPKMSLVNGKNAIPGVPGEISNNPMSEAFSNSIAPKVKTQAQIKGEITGTNASEPLPWETNNQVLEQVGGKQTLGQKIGSNQSQDILQPNPLSEPDLLQSSNSLQDKMQKILSPEQMKQYELYGKSSNPSITPKVNIPSDEATQNFAEGQTLIANKGNGGFGGFVPELKSAYQDWVNKRHATQVEGLLKKKEFSDLNNKGFEGIAEFQAGNKTGRFADVKKYFDQKHAELNKAGVEVNYKKDYLPQLWQNSQDEVNQVFNRSIGLRPSFSLESVIKDYKTGIAAGLKPKFNNISELAGWYEQRANKAIADRQFFDYLGKDGFIQAGSKAPQGWTTLADGFPKHTTTIDGTTYSGVYKAPPELAKVINNYLAIPDGPVAKIANFVSRAKNITLSFGIPGTGINAHGINILARHTLFGTGGNPISRLITGTHYMLDARAAQRVLEKDLSTAPAAIRNGLTISGEEHNGLLNEGETLAKSLGKNWNNLFEKPLFNKMIPSLKLSSYNELIKNGMEGKDAAKLVNNVYGGINWEQMGRSREGQNLLRMTILAPDWAETNLRLGGNLAKSLVTGGKVASRYRSMTATLLGAYISANIANKLTSGHYMYENDPGHTFEVQTGYTNDGSKRYFRPFGTAVDFARLPIEAIQGAMKGDISPTIRAITNRLSIPAASAAHIAANTDYLGNRLYGKDKYGQPIPIQQQLGSVGSEVIGAAGFPSFLKNAVDVATNKQGAEQGLTQGLELPFRYQGPGNSKTQQYVGKVAEVKGQQLYDLKKRFQGEAPFSDKQKAIINQGGMPALEAVMNERIVTRQSNQIKDIQKKAASGEISPEEAQKSMQNILKQPVNTPKQSNAGTNQAYAADNGVFEYNNKYSYISPTGKTTTVDINPPTKGQGIDAFVNTNWNITKAREVWNSQLPENTKDEIFKKLGVDKTDVRYDALANHNTDVSTQYLLSKSPNHEVLLHNIITGRKESISGTQFASNGVIDNLVEQGQLSKEEGKQLKALKFDKNGQSIGKSTSGGKKFKKPAKLSLKRGSKIPVKFSTNKVRVKTGKAPKLATPKVSFDTQFSKAGAIPKARKYQVKFNV